MKMIFCKINCSLEKIRDAFSVIYDNFNYPSPDSSEKINELYAKKLIFLSEQIFACQFEYDFLTINLLFEDLSKELQLGVTNFPQMHGNLLAAVNSNAGNFSAIF